MAGLVFLADFFGWTAQEAVEAYIFRTDVQYALNLEPGVDSLAAHRRTLPEALPRRRPRRPHLRRRHHPAHRDARSRRLPPAARLDPRLQPHGQLRPHQAHGRGDQAVPDPAQAARPRAYAALPEDLRRRYEPAESQLFADAKDAEARHAAGSKPPRTCTSSSTASPTAPTSRADRPIRPWSRSSTSSAS